MKDLIVNQDACIGCGSCIAVDPEHFDFNDDGLAKVISNGNLETNSLINAIGSCPTNAISIGEVSGCANCATCPGCASSNEEIHCDDKKCNCGDECECTTDDHCGCLD